MKIKKVPIKRATLTFIVITFVLMILSLFPVFLADFDDIYQNILVFCVGYSVASAFFTWILFVDMHGDHLIKDIVCLSIFNSVLYLPFIAELFFSIKEKSGLILIGLFTLNWAFVSVSFFVVLYHSMKPFMLNFTKKEVAELDRLELRSNPRFNKVVMNNLLDKELEDEIRLVLKGSMSLETAGVNYQDLSNRYRKLILLLCAKRLQYFEAMEKIDAQIATEMNQEEFDAIVQTLIK